MKPQAALPDPPAVLLMHAEDVEADCAGCRPYVSEMGEHLLWCFEHARLRGRYELPDGRTRTIAIRQVPSRHERDELPRRLARDGVTEIVMLRDGRGVALAAVSAEHFREFARRPLRSRIDRKPKRPQLVEPMAFRAARGFTDL